MATTTCRRHGVGWVPRVAPRTMAGPAGMRSCRLHGVDLLLRDGGSGDPTYRHRQARNEAVEELWEMRSSACTEIGRVNMMQSARLTQPPPGIR